MLMFNSGELFAKMPGENKEKPSIQTVYIIFPTPYQICKFFFCCDGIERIYNQGGNVLLY
jgi:hypothetical protein